MALSTCCAALSEPRDLERCQEVVEDAEADDCTRAEQRYCASAPGAPPPGQACEALESCCRRLQDDAAEDACEDLLDAEDDAACMAAQAQYCMEEPTAEACTMLMPCCAMQTDARDREECEEELEDGNPARCARAQTEFCP